jgi:RNA polymerase sigma-70 factor (ECF subfamily)
VAEYPETRASLIVRLKDAADEAAWGEFAELYRPVIYRFARRRGLQHADAEDLAQQVLSAVAAAVHRWEPDDRRGRFRTWLQRIAHNLVINSLTRRKCDRAAGDTAAHELISRQPAPDGPESELLRVEFRREVFHWAARQIRHEFQPDTWLAFWHTAVEQRPVPDVAAQLGKKAGAVYAARVRVMRRLKEKVLDWDGTGDPPPAGR